MMMKKSTKFRLFFATLILITGSNLFSQEVSWDFPVKPGTEKWNSFNDSFEKIAACQVPVDVLSALSTEQLIEVCLTYPLLFDILAFDNILTGLEAYSINFNGFRELAKRNDAALLLVKKYKDKDPLAIKKDWPLYDKFDYALKISMMELLLCNKQILSKLDNIEKKDLMNEYRLKKSQKNNSIDLYQGKGFQTIYLAIVKLLESENVDLNLDINMDNVTSFITTGILKSSDVFKEINNAVNNYLLNDLKPIGEEYTNFEDNSQVRVQANVYSPKGNSVTADQRTYEWSDTERAAWDNYYRLHYGNCTMINTYGGYSSTKKFNCLAYAWHVSERGETVTSEYRWIENVDPYQTDGSYIESGTHYPAYPLNPEKVLYHYTNGSIFHSGIIAPSYGIKYVISKWGEGPLMVHRAHDNPYMPYDTSNSSNCLTFYHLNPATSGNTNLLCEDATKSFTTDITNMPEGTLNWTKSGPVNVVGVSNAPVFTVNNAGYGTAQVYLSVHTLSGFNWTSSTYSFPVNRKPLISNQKVDGNTYYYGMGVSPGSHMLSFVPYPDDGSTTETWTVPSSIQYHIYQGEHKLGFYFVTNPSLTFTVKATNACGTGTVSTYYLTRQRGYIMTLHPNPASDIVTVTMTENIPSTECCDTIGFIIEAMTDIDTYTESVESTTFTIRIYNSQSALVYTCTRTGKSFNVPLINMKDGTYIFEVSDGENSYRQQLIVHHN